MKYLTTLGICALFVGCSTAPTTPQNLEQEAYAYTQKRCPKAGFTKKFINEFVEGIKAEGKKESQALSDKDVLQAVKFICVLSVEFK